MESSLFCSRSIIFCLDIHFIFFQQNFLDMQSASWGSYVSDTQNAKVVNSVPVGAGELIRARASAVSRCKGFGRGTVFNPLTGKWADPAAEQAVRSAAHESEVVRGNRARDRQLKHLQAFDLLNARPLVPENPARGQRETTESFSSRVPYNILSSLPLPDVLLTARARDGRLAARAQLEPPRPLKNAAPSLVRRRGIDIISNRYADDHDARKNFEDAAVRDRALRRYWQTRNFDPVRQVYEDPAKDAAYHADTQLSIDMQGVAQRERLPPSIRLALGQAYDIVGHRPRDAEVVELVDTMESRPLRRMNRRAVEQRLVEESDGVANNWEARRLRGMRSTVRLTELADPHGYDITTSLPRDFSQLQTTIDAGRAPSAWERIQSGLAENSGSHSGSHRPQIDAPRHSARLQPLPQPAEAVPRLPLS